MDGKFLSVQVYEKIKEGIISLKYPPESVLTERELAESLGVSRTPIREAIQRLAQESWLVPGDGKRMCVRPVTIDDVHEIIQIRNLVEYAAIKELYDNDELRVTAGQMDAVLNEMRGANELQSFIKYDLKFHYILVQSMMNNRLLRFWSTVQDEVCRMGLLALRGEDRWNHVIEEHEKVVESLWNKDFEKIQASMKEHLENSYRSLIAKFKNS